MPNLDQCELTHDPSQPAETPPGEYIEAALYALEANRPLLAYRYLSEAVANDDEPELAGEYEPNLGLNHTLRIAGVSYIYDPNTRTWDRGPVTYAYANMPYSLTAENIHAMMLDGVHVLPWTPRNGLGQPGQLSADRQRYGGSEAHLDSHRNDYPNYPFSVNRKEGTAPTVAPGLPQRCPEDSPDAPIRGHSGVVPGTGLGQFS